MASRRRSSRTIWSHKTAPVWLAWSLGVVALFGCTTQPKNTETAPWRSSVLGLCEDYPEESRSLERARADLAAVRATGAQVLRIAFGWDAMEPEPGHYDWSFWDDFVRIAVDEYGLRLIPYVCYTPKWAAVDQGPDFWRSPPRDPEDFARFMSAIVQRYKHAIQSWELWNEPDNPAYWLGTREQFAELVRAGSRAVRMADSRATIVLGGIAGETSFIDGLFRLDHIAPAVDVVNIHSYFETWHPDPIEWLPQYVGRARDIVRNHGENEPLWMAETGYSSVKGRAEVSGVYRAHFRGEHTERAQAVALARTIVMCLATGELPLIAWYRVNDLPATEEVIGDDNNRNLGVRTVNGQSKPAMAALTLLCQWFQQPYRIVRADVDVTGDIDSPVQIHAFELRDGRNIVAAWFGSRGSQPTNGDLSHANALAEDRRRAIARVRVPGVFAVRMTDATGKPLPDDLAGRQTRRNATELVLNLRGEEVILCELRPL